MIEVYFDGACGPFNPGGRCGGGAVVKSNGKLLAEICSEYVPEKKGETSNNIGEYWGLIKAMEFLKNENLNHEKIFVYGDSNMVINQMAGNWRINTKKPKIYTMIGLGALLMRGEFPMIKFKWIPREQNEWADLLSKRAIGY